MQAKQFMTEVVKVLTEIDSLNESLKELKDEAKASGLDVPALVAAAKAVVQAKCDEVIEKNEAVIEAINTWRS